MSRSSRFLPSTCVSILEEKQPCIGCLKRYNKNRGGFERSFTKALTREDFSAFMHSGKEQGHIWEARPATIQHFWKNIFGAKVVACMRTGALHVRELRLYPSRKCQLVFL